MWSVKNNHIIEYENFEKFILLKNRKNMNKRVKIFSNAQSKIKVAQKNDKNKINKI